MQSRLFAGGLIVITAIACGQQKTDSSALQSGSIDQASADVTVLQAWLSDKDAAVDFGTPWFTPDYKLNPDRCQTISSQTHQGNDGFYTRAEVDCSSELREKASQDFDKDSPLITEAGHSYIRRSVGSSYSESGYCEIVEFRTVIRDAALNSPVFNGIGFYYSRSRYDTTSRGKFIDKDQLHAVGHVTLKDGSPATVHRFIAQGMCFGMGGNGDSIYHRRYVFRPFARFTGDHDTTYNNWDNVQNNYLLGLSDNNVTVKTFDRQNDLLKQ